MHEISDHIIAFDPQTLERQAVHKEDAVAIFRQNRNRRAEKIIAAMPEVDGVLDPDYVDQLLIRVHLEMQGISEEFQHGQRVCELLHPLLDTLRQQQVSGPIRIVDIGCGTGYVLRWLAAKGNLGDDVELVGADYHVALIDEARRLAEAEQLDVQFVVANAFNLDKSAAVYLSTGVVHHFRDEHLVAFFANHQSEETQAFVHFDFQSTPFAALGSWIFHIVRMREPLSRHDGVVSAQRAHSKQVLVEAAKSGCPELAMTIYGARLWFLPLPRAMNALLGIRPQHKEILITQLAGRSTRLGVWR